MPNFPAPLRRDSSPTTPACGASTAAERGGERAFVPGSLGLPGGVVNRSRAATGQPRNRGARFSANAANPSAKSGVVMNDPRTDWANAVA